MVIDIWWPCFAIKELERNWGQENGRVNHRHQRLLNQRRRRIAGALAGRCWRHQRCRILLFVHHLPIGHGNPHMSRKGKGMKIIKSELGSKRFAEPLADGVAVQHSIPIGFWPVITEPNVVNKIVQLRLTWHSNLAGRYQSKYAFC